MNCTPGSASSGAIFYDRLPAPLDATVREVTQLHGERRALSLLCQALGAEDTPAWSHEIDREIQRAIDAGGVGFVASHVRGMLNPPKQKNARTR